MNKYPKALTVLKENAGKFNWIKLRRTYVRFLTMKREIEKLKSFDYLQRLLHKEFVDIINKIDYYPSDNMPKESIISHALNALYALRYQPYRSDMMCYITDSYNTAPKSGNKKYPYAK